MRRCSCHGPKYEAQHEQAFLFLSGSIGIAALAVFGAGWSAPALAADQPRIVSMNVCTDQVLLRLADPEQILGLSRFSGDARQSWTADDARRYRILSGGAEDVLVLRPDIAVASVFDKRSTRELLKEKGIHLVEFAVPRNLRGSKSSNPRDGRDHRAPRSRDSGNRQARCRGRARAPSRGGQTLSGAAVVPAWLGIRQRQLCQRAPDRNRPVQRGRRSRRRVRGFRVARNRL